MFQSPKLKRNDPCWCGSGKKYKKCHMLQDQQEHASQPRTAKSKYAKTPAEIEGMRKAGKFNGELMDFVRGHVAEGISTLKLDILVNEYTRDHGHVPATLGYQGFTRSICTSINNVVCHGIPSESEILRDGDIVNVDLTTIVDGFHGDSSETFLIGRVAEEVKKLVRVTAECMIQGIRAVGPGIPLAILGQTIEPYARRYGYSIVRQYTGHGIGRKFHENFSVYHHESNEGDNVSLQPGITFTIEPMVNMGGYQVSTDKVDKWTVRTKDGLMSAQFEHTVLITAEGCEVLTLTPSQKEKGVIIDIPGMPLEISAAI
ncbi:MAG: methionyl aminopeptidase [Chitinivibrionales bacterium]|nr:methionyl aminopeptidase [Chitinivibrionales bacterium]